MPFRAISFALFLHRLESLIRQDYAQLSVRKRDMNLLLFWGLILKSTQILSCGGSAPAFALDLCKAFMRALIAASPFFLIYKLHSGLGRADLKFAWLCGLLLPLLEAWGSLILACFWAAVNALPRLKKNAGRHKPFAFLPYLGLSSLPFIFKQIFIAGGS